MQAHGSKRRTASNWRLGELSVLLDHAFLLLCSFRQFVGFFVQWDCLVAWDVAQVNWLQKESCFGKSVPES